jgi:hypothetical protein
VKILVFTTAASKYTYLPWEMGFLVLYIKATRQVVNHTRIKRSVVLIMPEISQGYRESLVETGYAVSESAEVAQVRAWTRDRVFHLCKFANDGDLAVGGVIANACKRHLRYSDEGWAEKWNNKLRRTVKSALASKRNSMQQMIGLSVIDSIQKEEVQTNRRRGRQSVVDWNESTLQRLLEMKRDDDDLYRWFYANVCKYEAGAQRWKEKVETGQCLATEVVTPVDEAHGLVLLLNHWKEWERRAREGTARPENDTVLTVFTCKEDGGQRVSWSKEGLERFNELLAEVVEDRKSDTGKAFDEKFKADMEEAYGRRKRKRKKKVAPRETVEVVNMLDELMGEGTMDGGEVEGGADDGDDN